MAKRCPKCDTGYPDSDNFCIECGGRLEKVAERPQAAEPQIPRKLKEDFSGLQNSLTSMENELAGLNREVKALKGAGPGEDLELLKAAFDGRTEKIKKINSRLGEISRELGEKGKHIEGIESLIVNFANKQDMADLKRGIGLKLAKKAREQNEMFAEFQNQFTQGFKAQIDASLRRAGRLEAELDRLVNSLEMAMAKKMEGFKTGFNEKVSRAILELRNEVSQKTGIINKLKQNLEEQIKTNNERYADFEGRLKKGIESIDNLKEGLTVEQQGKMNEFQTLLLERIGEIKDHSEGIGKSLEKRIRANIEKDIEANALAIVNLKVRLGQLAKFENELKTGIKSMRGFRDGLEARFQKVIEDFSRQGSKAMVGLGGAARKEIKENAEDIRGLKIRIGRVDGLRADFERKVGSLRGLEASLKAQEDKNEEQLKSMEKLNEDLILHQQNRVMSLEARIGKELENLKQDSQAFVSSLEERVSKGMMLNSKEIGKVKKSIARLSALEASINKRLGETEALKTGIARDFVRREEIAEINNKLLGVEKRIVSIRVPKGLGRGFARREELAGIRERLGRIEGLKEETWKGIEEDLILQQQSKLISLESRVKEWTDGFRGEAEKAVNKAAESVAGDIGERLGEMGKLEARLEKLSAMEKGIARRVEKLEGSGRDAKGLDSLRREVRGAVASGEVLSRKLEAITSEMRLLKTGMRKGADKESEKIEAMDAFRQQLDLMKDFMENLEKRSKTETDGLEKKLDGISKIQEKQELEILTPKRKNTDRIIKNQIKNEIRGLEDRISDRILKRLSR